MRRDQKVSCAFNSVLIGEIASADWDMFHSKVRPYLIPV
jgi:hypothetical protein